MFKGHVATGTVEGTGSAINVQCGFMPAKVEIYNIDGLSTLNWTDSMPAGAGMKQVTAGTLSLIGSGGITAYAGSQAGDSAGFTIGTDADVNASAETIHWVAFGAE